MTITLFLLGFLALLFLPKVGHWIQHAILHPIVHAADHHPDRTMLILSGCVVLIFASIPTLLFFGFYFLALYAFLLLLIMFKVFYSGH